MLRRKLGRELYGSFGLLLLIASIIAVGVTCFVAMQSAYHNLSQAKRTYYQQCRMADFWVDLKKIPRTELERLSEIQGITDYRDRIQFSATVDVANLDELVNATVVSLPDHAGSNINRVLLRQGDYFTDRRRNEVIVGERFAEAHNLRPGSSLHVILNDRRQELVVVGTAISAEFAYLVGPGALVPDPIRFGVLYIKRSFAEEIFDFEGAANQIVGHVSPAADHELDLILRRVEDVLAPFGVFSTTPLKEQLSNQILTSEIEGLGATATVIPAIFLAVAALVLNILISRMARRQRVVIGTLKALGYSDARIFLHFLWYGSSVGIAGGIAGSFLGYLAASGLTVVYRVYFEFPSLESGFYWYTHAVGIAVSVGFAILGSLLGARRVLRLRPSEAMRPEPPPQGRAIWLERVFGDYWQQLSPRWRMALRDVFRQSVRSGTTIFAAMMGTGLLVSGFMMLEAQNFLIDFQFYRETRSDLDLAFKSEQGLETLEELRRLPGVDRVEPLFALACTFEHGPYRRKGAVTGLQSGARLTVPRNVAGQPIVLPESGIVMSRRLAEFLHVEPGAAVRVIPVKGTRRPVEVVVARIADSYMGLAAYGDIRFLSRLVGESYVLTGAQLAVTPQPEDQQRLVRALKAMPGLQSVQSRRHLIENLTGMMLEQQLIFVGVLVVFSGVIFLGSIVNASMVSLAEREREVGTLRALGYSQWQLGSIFLRENLLTNLVGVALGLPVGYGLTWLTAVSYASDVIRLPVVTADWIWYATLATSLVFALLAHGIVQWRLSGMNYLEALKVQE